jgi:hypothetical protein
MKIRGERVSQEQKQEECYHKEVGRNCLMDGLIFLGGRVRDLCSRVFSGVSLVCGDFSIDSL